MVVVLNVDVGGRDSTGVVGAAVVTNGVVSAAFGIQAIAETISASVGWVVSGVIVKTMRLNVVGLSSLTSNKPVEASTVTVFVGSTVPSRSVMVYVIVFTLLPLKLKLTNSGASVPTAGVLTVIIVLVTPSIRWIGSALLGITPGFFM